MTQRVDNFVFRGIMTAHAIRDLQSSGLLRTPTSTPEEIRDHDLFAAVTEKIRASSKLMQSHYRILYAFENSVRELLMSVFTEADGADWFDKRANSDMKKKYDSRKKDEETNNWHSGRHRHPLFYLDFGDLALLITNHWELFKALFPDQGWVNSRIKETERSRNVVAHTNELASTEGARMEMHLRDWIAQVG